MRWAAGVPEDATERIRCHGLRPLSEVAQVGAVSGDLASPVKAALAVNEGDRPQSLMAWRPTLAAATENGPVFSMTRIVRLRRCCANGGIGRSHFLSRRN